jgi:hypothetical protein
VRVADPEEAEEAGRGHVPHLDPSAAAREEPAGVRKTCFDSAGDIGWLDDTFYGCSWWKYSLGLRPYGLEGCEGGLSFYHSPAGIAEASAFVAAHELSHAVGRNHAGNTWGEAEGGGHDPLYPHLHGQLGGRGFDTTAWEVIPLGQDPEDVRFTVSHGCRSTECGDLAEREGACRTHDYLSYAPGPRWISAYTWNAILEQGFGGFRGIFSGRPDVESIDPGSGGGNGGGGGVAVPALHISGRTTGEGGIQYDPTYLLEAPENVAGAPEGEGSLVVTALGAGGEVLARRRVEPELPADGGPSGARFSFVLWFPPEAVRVEAELDGQPAGALDRSPGPPELAILEPTTATRVNAEARLGVRWEASDPDGNPLACTVQYRQGPAAPWRTIALWTQESEIEYPASELAGGDEAQVRVVASDGIWTVREESRPFRLEGKPPFPLIHWPRDGQTVPGGNILVFEGGASDREDGALDPRVLHWHSDRAGLLGAGERIDVEGLEPGRHVIRFEAVDSDGKSADAMVEVFVRAAGAAFVRGDADASGGLDISDAILTLNYLFVGNESPTCLDAVDANDSGKADISDALYSLSFLFLGGTAPPAPHPGCGADPTADEVECSTHPPCAGG